MDKSFKFVLPSPNFDKNLHDASKPKPYYLTPSGMSLLPREKQPPPMYGKHGATLPGKYLKQKLAKEEQFDLTTAVNACEKQYCESCELEFHSLEDLKRHRAQHEKCPVAGCQYKGHITVMDKHINAFHVSGLFDKFKKLSTPEEIAAWREERRKRYPTLANVLLKQKAKEQRRKRGERLDANKPRFGNVNDRKRAQNNVQQYSKETGHKDENKPNNKRNRKNKHKKCKNQQFKLKLEEKILSDDKSAKSDEDGKNDIDRFRGTTQLQDYKHFNDNKSVTSSVLYNLVGMYGSDDENSDSEDDVHKDNVPKIERLKEIAIEKNNRCISKQHENIETVRTDENALMVQSYINNESKDISKSEKLTSSDGDSKIQVPFESSSSYHASPVQSCTNFTVNETIGSGNLCPNGNSSDEGPDEVPIERSNPNCSVISTVNIEAFEPPEAKRTKLIKSTPLHKPKNAMRRKSGLDYRKARLRKQNTMLEKLLESDIKHERNVLLQCIRFVCENNFFNIGKNKDETLPKNIT